MLIFLSQVFNTSLAEPVPEGYEDVSNIVPPYSAFSPKGQPEVNNNNHTHKQTVMFEYVFTAEVKVNMKSEHYKSSPSAIW